MGKKGQFNLEYLVALVVFVSILVFLSIQIAFAVPSLHTKSMQDRLSTKAYGLTDILMFTEGEPATWEAAPTTARRIGLSAGQPYRLAKSKIDGLQTLCADYESLRNKLAVTGTSDFRIVMIVDGIAAYDCGARFVPAEATRVIVRREGYCTDCQTQNVPVQLVFTLW